MKKSTVFKIFKPYVKKYDVKLVLIKVLNLITKNLRYYETKINKFYNRQNRLKFKPRMRFTLFDYSF